MNKTIKIPDIAMWEETDSELAKYNIQQLANDNKELLKTYDELENENRLLLQRATEEHQQICNAIDYIKRERACFIDDVTIQKLLYNIEYLLRGER